MKPSPNPYREIQLGRRTVHWLPSSAPIDEAESLALLHPDDRTYAASLKSPARKAEFLRSRWLLEKLNLLPADSATRTPEGVPRFANNVPGSISHKSGEVVISAGNPNDCLALGIDLEDTGKVHCGIADKICTPGEIELLDRHSSPGNCSAPLDTVRTSPPWIRGLCTIFSFKEALFKAHYPLGRTMFYFHDAEVTDLPDLSAKNGKFGGMVRGTLQVTTSPKTPAGTETIGWCIGLDASGVASPDPKYILSMVEVT